MKGAHAVSPKSTDVEERLGLFFYVCFAIGWLIIAFGVWSMFKNKGLTNPTYTFELGLGANIFHDAILAPAVCVFGYLLGRVIPRPLRGPVNWGLFSSAVVSLIAYPAVRGFGRKADNPTVLPLNYATALIAVLCVIWALVIVACLLGVSRMQRAAHPSTQTDVPSA